MYALSSLLNIHELQSCGFSTGVFRPDFNQKPIPIQPRTCAPSEHGFLVLDFHKYGRLFLVPQEVASLDVVVHLETPSICIFSQENPQQHPASHCAAMDTLMF